MSSTTSFRIKRATASSERTTCVHRLRPTILFIRSRSWPRVWEISFQPRAARSGSQPSTDRYALDSRISKHLEESLMFLNDILNISDIFSDAMKKPVRFQLILGGSGRCFKVQSSFIDASEYQNDQCSQDSLMATLDSIYTLDSILS